MLSDVYQQTLLTRLILGKHVKEKQTEFQLVVSNLSHIKSACLRNLSNKKVGDCGFVFIDCSNYFK